MNTSRSDVQFKKSFLNLKYLIGIWFLSIATGISVYADIHWIFTGGTLSMTDSNSVRKDPSAERVLTDYHAPNGVQLTYDKPFGEGIDSSQILSQDIVKLIKSVYKYIESHSDQTNVPMITHGTDSLATTGAIISQIFPDRFIVLTAAFKPYDAPGSDAKTNIDAAFLLAGYAKNSKIPRVPYVVINNNVYLASSVVKLDIEYGKGKRGFSSYYGRVGHVTNGHKITWDQSFLENFESDRKLALESTRQLRQAIYTDIAGDKFNLNNVEIAYVNSHTPKEYLNAVYKRSRSGAAKGLILLGKLDERVDVLGKLWNLAYEKHPIILEQKTFETDDKAKFFEIPDTMDPSQIWAKMAVYGLYAKNIDGLIPLFKLNLAGEIAPSKIDKSLKAEFVAGDFYQDSTTKRSFLVYFQDEELFREVLVSEIIRLGRHASSGHKAELIIEGLGNGHVFIGKYSHPRKSVSSDSARAKLESAESFLEMTKIAAQLGVKVIISSSPPDATPNAAYEVGKTLQGMGVGFANSPGRTHIKALASSCQ